MRAESWVSSTAGSKADQWVDSWVECWEPLSAGPKVFQWAVSRVYQLADPTAAWMDCLKAVTKDPQSADLKAEHWAAHWDCQSVGLKVFRRAASKDVLRAE